jgi:hypothetical protein
MDEAQEAAERNAAAAGLKPEVKTVRLLGLQIPMHRGHPLRFDRGQATDLMAATIPI